MYYAWIMCVEDPNAAKDSVEGTSVAVYRRLLLPFVTSGPLSLRAISPSPGRKGSYCVESCDKSCDVMTL